MESKVTISDVSPKKFDRIKKNMQDLGNGVWIAKNTDPKLLKELKKCIPVNNGK